MNNKLRINIRLLTNNSCFTNNENKHLASGEKLNKFLYIIRNVDTLHGKHSKNANLHQS